MDIKAKYILAVFILLVISVPLRLYRLASVPSGFYVDEAALGYNAYSILQTGRDEYGKAFPVFLRSFGTYTSALVVYLITVPIKLLGLSVFSVRIVSVTLGLLATLAFSVLAAKSSKANTYPMFLIGGLILSLGPSFVLFNRAFYEPTLSLLLLIIGAASILDKKWIRGLIFLSLATYSYHSSRLFVYLFILGFLFLSKNKSFWVGLLIFAATQIPLLYLSLFSGPSQRLNTLTWAPNIIATNVSLPQKIYDLVWEFSSQYLAYYSPKNLFHLPDPDFQRSLPELSVFYPWLVIPFFIGLLNFRKHFHPGWVFLWLVVSPVAAALTKDPFSTIRALPILVPISLLIASGIASLLSGYKPVILMLSALSILQLWRSLFILLPNERVTEWSFGYQRLFQDLSRSSLPAVIDDDKPVYILYLFFQRIDPRLVQNQSPIFGKDYYTDVNWKNYYRDDQVRFEKLVWKEDIYKLQLIAGNDLLISSQQASEHFLDKLFTINSPQNLLLLSVYKTNPDKKTKTSPQP